MQFDFIFHFLLAPSPRVWGDLGAAAAAAGAELPRLLQRIQLLPAPAQSFPFPLHDFGGKLDSEALNQ